MDFVTKLQQALDLTAQGSTVDILPLCREHISEFTELMDQAIEWHLLHQAFQNGYLGLKATDLHFGPVFTKGFPLEHLEPDDAEPDYLIYQKAWDNKTTPPARSLQRLLAIILLSDCTDCCNALEAIKINRYGLIAYGNMSMTYHS